MAYGATKKGAVTNAGYTRLTRFGDQSSANAKKDEVAPVQINRVGKSYALKSPKPSVYNYYVIVTAQG